MSLITKQLLQSGRWKMVSLWSSTWLPSIQSPASPSKGCGWWCKRLQPGGSMGSRVQIPTILLSSPGDLWAVTLWQPNALHCGVVVKIKRQEGKVLLCKVPFIDLLSILLILLGFCAFTRVCVCVFKSPFIQGTAWLHFAKTGTGSLSIYEQICK